MAQEQIAETALKSLFDKEYQNLCRFANSYVNDEHLAEDVVQNTFIKIWEQKKELLLTNDARYYLVTSVRNNCISELRRSKNITFPENSPETDAEPFFSHMLQKEEYTEQQERIATALDKLPPKCKEIFLMIKLHGMSYKQTAEALSLSVKTVENQMGKAIKTFRNLYLPMLLSWCKLFTINNIMLP